MVLSGGGAENDLWCQIFADVFQVPVKRAKNAPYCGAKGAAILAMGCDLDKRELQKLFKSNKVELMWEPKRENASLYQELFEIYKTVYEANKEEFIMLRSFREKYNNSK